MSSHVWDRLRTTFHLTHQTNIYRLIHHEDDDRVFRYSLSVIREGQDQYVPLTHGLLNPIVCSVISGTPLWSVEYPRVPHPRHHALLSQLGFFHAPLGAVVALEKFLQYRAKSGPYKEICKICRQEIKELLRGEDGWAFDEPPTLVEYKETKEKDEPEEIVA